MKKLIITFLILLFAGTGFAQNDKWIRVEKQDWEFVKNTAMELDSALTECQELDSLKTLRIFEYSQEVEALRLMNQTADSIMVMKDLQLEKRQEQVDILNASLRKKKFEIWMYRTGGIALIIIGGILIVAN